jgi:hypothetical protein
LSEEYERITGRSGMKYLRPPQGEFRERTLAVTGHWDITISSGACLRGLVPMAGGAEGGIQSEKTHS